MNAPAICSIVRAMSCVEYSVILPCTNFICLCPVMVILWNECNICNFGDNVITVSPVSNKNSYIEVSCFFSK